MRVLHAEAGGEEEALLSELDRRADRFWRTSGTLSELGAFAADLALEPGCDAVGRPITLLRSGEPSARPLIERLLSRLPAELAAEYAALQPRLPLARALAEVRARTGVDLTRATARAGFARG